MRSSRPSASVRSSLPFSKARRVNSPGSAGRTFSNPASAANNAASTARPPWTWNSATSSPVALAGPGNHNTTASSIGRWPTSLSSARVAIRGDGIFPTSAVTTFPACGPETRTMAIALGGRPDDSAKMVWSRGCIAYLCKRPWKGNAISIRPTECVEASGQHRGRLLQVQHNRPPRPCSFAVNIIYYRYLVR